MHIMIEYRMYVWAQKQGNNVGRYKYSSLILKTDSGDKTITFKKYAL